MVLTRRRNLAPHIGGHQIGFSGFLEQLLVQLERRLNVFGGNAADREADVIEHVVARGNRLVHQIEPYAPLHAPEVDHRRQFVHINDQAGNTKAHHALAIASAITA